MEFIKDGIGLEEGLKCAICKNNMKSDSGCDGGCLIDETLYTNILDVIKKYTSSMPVDEVLVVKDKDGFYFCGLSKWDKQLRNAKLYHSEAYAKQVCDYNQDRQPTIEKAFVGLF